LISAVLDNSTDFETKLRRCVSAVERMVGLPTSERRTRRFRLARCPPRDSIPAGCEEFDVEKVYLRLADRPGGRHPGDHTFVRRRGQQAMASYSQTDCRYVREPPADGAAAGAEADGAEAPVRKIERKRIITAREYSNAVRFLADPARHVVRQRRISFLWEGQYFEITEYLAPQEAAGLTMLNVQVHAPPKGEMCVWSGVVSFCFLLLFVCLFVGLLI
jgi:hypothetical protein